VDRTNQSPGQQIQRGGGWRIAKSTPQKPCILSDDALILPHRAIDRLREAMYEAARAVPVVVSSRASVQTAPRWRRRQGKKPWKALLRLAQHHPHARLDVLVEEVQLDAEQPNELRSRRSRYGTVR
jgi:hypothetical protein